MIHNTNLSLHVYTYTHVHEQKYLHTYTHTTYTRTHKWKKGKEKNHRQKSLNKEEMMLYKGAGQLRKYTVSQKVEYYRFYFEQEE